MKKNENRTYNSIINSIIGISSAFINIFINFAVRIVIVRFLGDEITGIHSLFQSIMSVLAVTETSLTTAMIIHLYRPVKENNKTLIENLMNVYRNLYKWLATGFFCFSIVINAFLDNIVSVSETKIIHIYFCVFSCSYIINYLTYSYRCILYGEQKNRFSVIATTISEFVFRGLGLIAVCIFREYWIYLVCLIFEKICGNMICKRNVSRRYPYLVEDKSKDVNKNLRNNIIESVKPLFVNQIANTIQNSATPVIISIVRKNIVLVGYYGNYQLVIGAIQLLFSQIGAAFTSSFGNLAVENNLENMRVTYKRVDFIISSLAIVFSCGFIACINDFITMAFGKGHILTFNAAILLTINMFINIKNVTIISIQNATGTHKLDSKNMVMQAIATVVLGVVFGSFWGVEGVILGLILPILSFTTIAKGVLISRKTLDLDKVRYIKGIIKSLIIFILAILLAIKIGNCIVISNLLISFIAKGIVSVFIAFIVISISSYKSDEYKYTLSLLGKMFFSRR